MPSACAASAGVVLERLALVRRVPLDGLDEVRDQIPAALELDLDLRPGVVHAVPLLNEAVVEGDEQQPDDHDDRDDHDDPDHGRWTLPRLRHEDHVLHALVRAAVEPAVDGVDFEARFVEQAQPFREREPVEAE
jgi:hypothetical protein